MKPGTRCIFNYPREFVTLPDYSAHRGQAVTIVRPLRHENTPEGRREYDLDPNGEGGDPMYEVRADDGWLGHAWESELAPS